MTHLAPAPTVTSKIIDAQQITRTTWTVGDHTLTRIQRGDAGDAYWSTGTLHDDAPDVSEGTAHWHDDTAPIAYTVNWSALGARSPEDALEYASRLMAAANAARVFAAIRA